MFTKSIPVSPGLRSLKTGASEPREHPPITSKEAKKTAALRRCTSRNRGVFSDMTQQHLSRVINLIPSDSQRFWTIDESEARRRLLASDLDGVLAIDGSFALVAQDGERVLLAR